MWEADLRDAMSSPGVAEQPEREVTESPTTSRVGIGRRRRRTEEAAESKRTAAV